MTVRTTTGGTTVDLELNLGRLLDRNPQLQIPRDEYNINVTSNEGDRLGSLSGRRRRCQGHGQGQGASRRLKSHATRHPSLHMFSLVQRNMH